MEKLIKHTSPTPEEIISALGGITVENVGEARRALISADHAVTHKGAQEIINLVRSSAEPNELSAKME